MDLIPVCTTKEMQAIEKKAIAGNLNKGFALMQKATQALLDIVIQDSKNFSPVTYFIFAGKGNNGGDGILLASYLIDQGYNVLAFIIADPTEIKAEAALAYAELQKRDPDNLYHRFINREDQINICINALDKSDSVNYVIDALLGVGATGAPRDLIATAIKQINNVIRANQERTRLVAIDIPSGVDADSGEVYENAFTANLTVSIGFPKLGSYFYPAKYHFSSTLIEGLDYPLEIVQSSLEYGLFFPTMNFFKKALPRRKIDGSKFDHGVVLSLSASPGMSGAGVLSAYAAYKSGAGLVKVISDLESTKIMATKLTEAVYYSYAESKSSALNTVKELMKSSYDAICIGPGLGKEQKSTIEHILKHSTAPIILDADGLNSFAGDYKKFKDHHSELLLTPHRGEYLRLFPDDFNEYSKPIEIISALKKRAEELKAIILLKGNPTLIADAKGHVFVMPHGNSALATAGSGDVLTGIISGLVAQISLRAINPNPEITVLTQAAILATYLHARAGEFASIELTEYGTIATDIVGFVPLAFKELIG